MNRVLYLGLGFICVFLVNPISGILITTFAVGISSPKHSRMLYNILIIFLAAFLSLINTTKKLESDLLYVYYEQFSYIKGFSYNQFLLYVGKEPVFYTAMYILRKFFVISFRDFVFLVSFCSYTLYLKSVYILLGKQNNLKQGVLLGLYLSVLFFELFSFSAHLLRQFLATSFLLFIAVNHSLGHIRRWILISCMVFIHSSSIIFLPFLLIQKFNNKIKIKEFILLGLCLMLAFFLINNFGSQLSGLGGGVGYIFSRLTEKEFDDGGKLVLEGWFLVILVFVALLYLCYLKTINKASYLLFNMFLFICLFVFSVANQPLLAYRYAFYVYFLPAFIIPILFNSSRNYLFKFTNITIILLLFFRFIDKYENGTWTYQPIDLLITNSFFHYFV